MIYEIYIMSGLISTAYGKSHAASIISHPHIHFTRDWPDVGITVAGDFTALHVAGGEFGGAVGGNCASGAVYAGVDQRGTVNVDVCAVVEHFDFHAVNFLAAFSGIETDIMITKRAGAGIFETEADVGNLIVAFQRDVYRCFAASGGQCGVGTNAPTAHGDGVVFGFELAVGDNNGDVA